MVTLLGNLGTNALIDYINGTGVQTFDNISEARRTFPDLRLRSLLGHSSRFSGPMRGELEGKAAIRYETTAACLFWSE